MADSPSILLLEEYFATGDDRFVAALRAFNIPGRLATLADRWKKDPRPWARLQILNYLEQPLNAPAHETVVKRLFKYAEAQADDELMAAFAVAFDRLVRRKLVKRHQYDYRSRQSWYEEWLRTPHNTINTPAPNAADGPVAHGWKPFKWHGNLKTYRLFSHHTRYYLRRRAWRYFRRMGFSQPERFAPAVGRMLAGYRDEDFARGENLLDSWILLHACFGKSDVLEFGPAHVKVREGRALRELAPAPQFPKLWKEPAAAAVLLQLMFDARSRLARVWAIQLIRREHADRLKDISVAEIRRMLDHGDEEVQILGAELLENAAGLEKLTVEQWVDLLGTKNLTALETICSLMSRHVRGDRVSLEQAVALAVSKPAPIARLGFGFLKDREARSDGDRDTLALLSAARSTVLAREISLWALARVGAAGVYNVDRVARFFDSLTKEVRQGAMQWLAPTSAGWNDAELWSRLVETPYDDVRLEFISALQRRSRAPGLGADRLNAVWCAVLLGIHRGGRHKLTALRQISDALREQPEAAAQLLPVLAVAIRSVRVPEARAGLSAIVTIVSARPELADLVARYLPELRIVGEEVGA
ncbi:MAG TPA: hypothetical protein VFE47_05145 [Tepidisphaeraceae bacterium]|nr:hypothetical protein [Tepidisphaeraceae bacterium]